MFYPKIIVSNQKEESISIQRVNKIFDLTFFILANGKQVFRHTLKTQMKWRFMQHFIRVFTVCLDKNSFQEQKYTEGKSLAINYNGISHWRSF